MDVQSKIAFCQIIAQILIVDGVLTDVERSFLQSVMNELQMTDEERTDVFTKVNIDDSIEDRLALLDREALQALLIEMRAASSLDGHIDPVERALIDTLIDRIDRP